MRSWDLTAMARSELSSAEIYSAASSGSIPEAKSSLCSSVKSWASQL